jgi:PAS domain S-box-containing protein
MLEALPDAVVISVDAKIVFANAAALEMFGAKDAAELVGRDAHSLAPADLRGSQRARRQKVLAEQCTLPPTEQKRVRLDGTLFDVETVATFMMWEGKSAFIGVLRDITARKAAELNLAETERRLSAVADHILGAVYQQVQSPDGTVTFSYVSAGVCEVTGLMPEQIIDDPAQFIDTIREDFRGQYRAHFRKSAADLVPSDFEFPIIRQDGCLRWIHTSGRPQRRVDGTVVWDGVMFDVTDKKIAQENAERNHQWLLQAIDSMPTGFMLWDTDDRLVLWNNLASSYHHDPAMFREGLSFEDMLQLPYEDRKRHLGVDGADEWLVERREQHKAADGNYEFQGKNNSWFTLRERTTPDGFTVTMVSDVSDLYDSRTLLQESEERYRAMINLSPDAIYVHKQGIIAVCNEAAIELFGAESSDELIGRELLELTHPEHREAARKRRSSVVEEGTRTLVMRQKRLRLDGSWFWAEVAAAAINWEGERGGVVVLRDVTAQIASEDELIRSKEAAELANRAKTEFLANISHELRTPLNAIIGFSDLMQREMLGPLGNEQYASYIGDIHQSGTHLHDVINDILDLSKIEAGQMELQESSVDVLGAIERCIRVVAARAADSGLTLTTQLPESLPYVVADERKLKQIFINLMSNAVKFTGRGGTITVAARSDPQEGVSIEIADTGIGIADDDIPKVFRAFEQVDSSLSRTHEGTGLGLPLTKSLVELHGGTLTLQSQIDAGTTITVSLPADRISSKPLAAE